MMVTNRKIFDFLFLVALAGAAAFVSSAFAAEAEHATLIREESLYGSAGANAQKTAQVGRGKAMEEKYLREVIAKFPQSKQAELAAYDLLEGQLCPEWRGMAECPTKESALYEQYAHEHPQSPKAAEALYNAAWRQAALTDIYRISNDRTKSDAARKQGIAVAQQIQSQQQDQDWKTRATDLIYKLEKKIPIYGPAV